MTPPQRTFKAWGNALMWIGIWLLSAVGGFLVAFLFYLL